MYDPSLPSFAGWCDFGQVNLTSLSPSVPDSQREMMTVPSSLGYCKADITKSA